MMHTSVLPRLQSFCDALRCFLFLQPAMRLLAVAVLLLVGLACVVADPPPNATVCVTGADDVDPEMLQCYDWDLAEDCDVEAGEIDYNQRCNCSNIIHEGMYSCCAFVLGLTFSFADMDSVLNYYKLHYCTLKAVPALSIILHIFW